MFQDTSRLSVLWAIAGLLLAVAAGCDAAGPPATLLFEDTVTFEFRFASEGGAVEAASEERVDFAGELEDDGGFTKDDVVRVTVTGARLERLQPVGQDLAELFDAVELRLTAPELSAAPVARATEVPADHEMTLAPLAASEDVARFIRQPAFGATLAFEQLEPSAAYVFELDVTFQVEVEGL